ncbi:MAG: prepilin peptidase [Bacillota bacterium]
MEFVVVYIFGMIIGSFLNVCIYRIPLGVSVVLPRSYCPHCRKQLKNYDLIPIFSFLLLGGRCRYCRAKISRQYPLVEFLAGAIGLLLFLKFGFSIAFLRYLLLAYLLMVIAFIDFKEKRIPNLLIYPGLIVGVLWAVFNGKEELLSSVSGAVLGGAILFPIAYFFPQGMGMGDVKLLALIGAFMGIKLLVPVLFAGSALGAILGLILILSKVITRKTPIPFGPFLAAGAIIILLFQSGG